MEELATCIFIAKSLFNTADLMAAMVDEADILYFVAIPSCGLSFTYVIESM